MVTVAPYIAVVALSMGDASAEAASPAALSAANLSPAAPGVSDASVAIAASPAAHDLAATTLLSGAPVAASLTPTIVGAVLLAALLHAIWNSIAHGISDRLVGFALIGLVDCVGGAAVALVAGLPPAHAWPYIIASAAVHVFYNVLLLVSYQNGEFSQTYPLARGSAPLIVTVFSIVVLGHHLSGAELVGIGAVSAGLISLVFIGGTPGRRQLPAIVAATATGVMIATYTIIDGVGVQQSPLLAYIGWMFFLQGPALPIIAVIRRGRRIVEQVRRCAALGIGGGLCSIIAYSIVLWAQTSGALAPIAALRESSIVFGSLIGAAFLGERLGRLRAAAAVVVVTGVVVLALP